MPAPVFLTPADLAARWQTTTGALADERYRGVGPSYLKLGARVRYRLADVEAYEAECERVAS